MRQPVQHGPPASSRHHRPAATTSLRVHAMQRLLLLLGAKRLKPGVSRQATSRAHPAMLSSPHQASAAACPDALPRVRVRCPPLRPTPRATASARSSTSGKSAALRALHMQLALPLLATVLAGTPTLLRARKRPPPSLRWCARLRPTAPSAAKLHIGCKTSRCLIADRWSNDESDSVIIVIVAIVSLIVDDHVVQDDANTHNQIENTLGVRPTKDD
jgi:hypothetical protein